MPLGCQGSCVMYALLLFVFTEEGVEGVRGEVICMGLPELRPACLPGSGWAGRPWGFSPEARRGSQGASRAAPGKSGLHARGEGERVLPTGAAARGNP